MRVEIANQPFQPNEVLRFRVNYSAEEYTSLVDNIFGTITIHDPTVIPDTRGKRVNIFPGKYYEFQIVEQLNKLLPPPYNTNCTDYMMNNGIRYNVSGPVHPYLDAPLSQEDCMKGCIAENTMKTCNCWPMEVPFLIGFKDHPKINNTLWCDWGKSADGNETLANEIFTNCSSRFETGCRDQCPRDCL